METVLIVIHLMVVAALVAVVLLQRSEGGALGIGGSGGFLTTRGSANVLTRSTAILAAAFFATSIVLTLVARMGTAPTSIIDVTGQPAPTGQGILDQLQPPTGAGGAGEGAATGGTGAATGPADGGIAPVESGPGGVPTGQ